MWEKENFQSLKVVLGLGAQGAMASALSLGCGAQGTGHTKAPMYGTLGTRPALEAATFLNSFLWFLFPGLCLLDCGKDFSLGFHKVFTIYE